MFGVGAQQGRQGEAEVVERILQRKLSLYTKRMECKLAAHYQEIYLPRNVGEIVYGRYATCTV